MIKLLSQASEYITCDAAWRRAVLDIARQFGMVKLTPEMFQHAFPAKPLHLIEYPLWILAHGRLRRNPEAVASNWCYQNGLLYTRGLSERTFIGVRVNVKPCKKHP